MYCLLGGKKRFGQLGALIPSISKKILTEQLKELENDGIILRVAFNEIPPRVEYSLTEKGETLLPILKEMSEWGKKYALMGLSN
jgi:DNA-binding HxlR family transcriptional regulator